MQTDTTETCCPPFGPERWDEKEVIWQNKPFVKARVRSFLHIPLNFASVMVRASAAIQTAGVELTDPAEQIVVSDENSLWGADVYVATTGPLPAETAQAPNASSTGCTNASLTGRFLCKVFEGPYKNMRKWIEQMQQYLAERDMKFDKLLCYYTTCPKCAKQYGKNYVVLLAKLGEG